MRDEALAFHVVLGCLLLNADWGWQAVWLVVLAVGWGFGAAVVKRQARAVFVPGGGA